MAVLTWFVFDIADLGAGSLLIGVLRRMLSPPRVSLAHSLLLSQVSGMCWEMVVVPKGGKTSRQNDLYPYGATLKLIQVFYNQ